MRTASLGSTIAFVAFITSSGAALAGSLSADVERQAQQNLPELLDLLAIPNVADQPADIQRNATFLEQAFAKRGFKVRRVDNPAQRPAVLAELSGAGPQARTVLLYAHFDGQPIIPENWSQQDPFRPVVKRRDAQGKWQDVGRQALQANPLDPELRVFARSASDDKAPIMMILTAVDLLRAQRKSPAINVKVLLDPEEEMGSPSLAGMIESDRAAFAADAMVILDGPQHDSGRSTLVFGNRGITQATLTVFGPRRRCTAGTSATTRRTRRCAWLAARIDEGRHGRVLVKGYYDGVSLSSAERASLTAVGDDEAALRKRIGIARAEKVGDTYQEALQYPSLNVRGMGSAGIGAKAANIVPSEAVAEIDIRTTPTTDGRKLFELIKRHIEQQGYRLVDQTPSDEDRARTTSSRASESAGCKLQRARRWMRLSANGRSLR